MPPSKEQKPTDARPSSLILDTHHLSPMKLMAKDHEDLLLLSSHLQDAFLPLHGMVFDMKNRIFSMLCHRFCWEHADQHTFEGNPLYHRVSTGLTFHHIHSAHYYGFHEDLLHPHEDYNALENPSLLHHYYPLNLLMIESEPMDAHTSIRLVCSGDKALRLTVDAIHCTMGDISHPWPTHHKPFHHHE